MQKKSAMIIIPGITTLFDIIFVGYLKLHISRDKPVKSGCKQTKVNGFSKCICKIIHKMMLILRYLCGTYRTTLTVFMNTISSKILC